MSESDLSREMSETPHGSEAGQCLTPRERGRVSIRLAKKLQPNKVIAKSNMRHAADDRMARLTRTIESEIIPRLLLANSAVTQVSTAAPAGLAINAAMIDDFAVLAVEGQPQETMAFVRTLQARGASLESIFLHLLAPAARQLGTAWEEDTLGFVEVTLGLGHLQNVMRGLCPEFDGRPSQHRNGHHIMLLQATGETHSFGLFMVEAFFRRAGWNVACAASMPLAEAAALARSQWIDVIGVSKSCDALLDTLASDITALRKASRNKSVTVIVGGAAFVGRPDRVTQVGADATASDGQQAVSQADRLVKSVTMRSV